MFSFDREIEFPFLLLGILLVNIFVTKIILKKKSYFSIIIFLLVLSTSSYLYFKKDKSKILIKQEGITYVFNQFETSEKKVVSGKQTMYLLAFNLRSPMTEEEIDKIFDRTKRYPREQSQLLIEYNTGGINGQAGTIMSYVLGEEDIKKLEIEDEVKKLYQKYEDSWAEFKAENFK